MGHHLLVALNGIRSGRQCRAKKLRYGSSSPPACFLKPTLPRQYVTQSIHGIGVVVIVWVVIVVVGKCNKFFMFVPCIKL